MKAKISRGKGFKGALNYVLDDEKNAQIVGGNMSSHTPAELSSEFKASRSLRPDCKKPVWHCSLSLPQGERLSDQKWKEVANDYMHKMGLDPANHQFTVVRHSDTEHDHVHIVASRIGLDSKLWHGQHDVRQAINACQELEQSHGLTLTPGLNMDEHKSSLKRGEIEIAVKTGEPPVKLILQQAIDEALADAPDTAAFIERLEAAGITPQPNIASTGRMNGFSFELDGIAFKASQLGKSYSWAQLRTRGLDYDQERDTPVLRAAKERSTEKQEDLAPGQQVEQPQRKRTVDYLQEDRPGEYRFKSGKRVVVKELENGGMWCAKTDTAAKAALQLALDKGWSTITVKTEDQAHAERLYRAALQVGYPPHVITLAHDQLTPEQINEINKEFGYEQDRASQSVSDTAQQSNFSADTGAAAVAKQQRRELSAADRAFSSSAGSAERREPRSDHAASQNSSAAAAQERGAMAAGSREVERSDRRLEARASSAAQSNRADQHSEQPKQEATARRNVENLDSSDQHRHADSAGAADRIHDLSAAAFGSREKRGEVLQRDSTGTSAANHRNSEAQQPVAPHIKAKQHAWRQQHEALQAPAYRITLTARREELKTYNHGKNKGPDNTEKFYTAQEVQELIPQLSRQNARGYDIYITPISDQQHYIVLDDTDKQRLEQMQARTGITPALIQESSPGNLQAIIVADKAQGQHEQSNANFLVQGLNKAYGDPKFTGVVHPFRLAGFMNQKPIYESQGRRPIVRPRPVLSCRPGADPVLNKMLEKQREQQAEQQQRQRVQERTQRIESFNEHSKTGIDERYKELAQKYCKYVDLKGWERDWSRIDYAVAGELLKQNYYSESQIAHAIRDNSPGIDERKQNPDYYARQTVAKAAQSPEVQREMQRQHEPEMEMEM